MEDIKVSATLKDPDQQAIRDRARLLALGRADGLSEQRLARALRAGNVSRLKGIERPEQHVPREYGKAIDPARLDQVTAVFFEELKATPWPACDLEDIRSPSRLRRYAWPRHVLTHLLRSVLKDAASYPTIAAYLCRKDHTSIIYSAQQAEIVFVRSPLFAEVAARVRARFKEES